MKDNEFALELFERTKQWGLQSLHTLIRIHILKSQTINNEKNDKLVDQAGTVAEIYEREFDTGNKLICAVYKLRCNDSVIFIDDIDKAKAWCEQKVRDAILNIGKNNEIEPISNRKITL